MTFLRTTRVGPLLVLLLVACGGLSINLQGWKARIPTFDLLPHIRDADALVRRGEIPMRGTLSSLNAYTPPGDTWLMAPGLMLTNDPRLFEFAGSSVLYVGTLVGIFLLARVTFGAWAAGLAVVLFGLSDVGGFFASSLWPRGHPFFVVWMVYWLRRWAVEGSARALAVALVFWAAGMYVFMEIAPAALLVPACWFVYRPPIRFAPIAAAAVASVAIWSPYLLYEAARDFGDLRALLARKPVYAGGVPANYQETWCDPGLAVRDLTDGTVSRYEGAATDRTGGESSQDAPDLRSRVAQGGFRLVQGAHDAIGNAVRGTVEGPRDAWTTARRAVLFLASVSSLIALTLGSRRIGGFLRSRTIRRPRWCTALGVALLVAGASAGSLPRLMSPDASLEPATRATLAWLQVDLVVAGVVFSSVKPIGAGLQRLSAAMGGRRADAQTAFIAVALVVPWVFLLLTAEPGRDDRFWWLSALHAVAIAGLVGHVLPRLGVARGVRIGVAAVALIAACATPSKAARLQSWVHDGWSGTDSDEKRAIDYLGRRLGGQQQVRVGYQIAFPKFAVALHGLDPRYKVGAEMDLLLEYWAGLTNANTCAEGLAPDDDYRLVERQAPPSSLRQYRFEPEPGWEVTPVFESGNIRVLQGAAYAR
jgi:hypothetical protein